MTSQRQIEANRRNAILSTGPRTAEGKATSSRNATTHGLRSRQIVLDTEDQEAFQDLLTGLEATLSPHGAHEQHLVLQLASLQWRLLRLVKMESALIEKFVRHGWPDNKKPPKDLPDPTQNEDAKLTEALGQGLGYWRVPSAITLLTRSQNNLTRAFLRALDDLQKSQAARNHRRPSSASNLSSIFAKQTQSDSHEFIGVHPRSSAAHFPS